MERTLETMLAQAYAEAKGAENAAPWEMEGENAAKSFRVWTRGRLLAGSIVRELKEQNPKAGDGEIFLKAARRMADILEGAEQESEERLDWFCCFAENGSESWKRQGAEWLEERSRGIRSSDIGKILKARLLEMRQEETFFEGHAQATKGQRLIFEIETDKKTFPALLEREEDIRMWREGFADEEAPLEFTGASMHFILRAPGMKRSKKAALRAMLEEEIEKKSGRPASVRSEIPMDDWKDDWPTRGNLRELAAREIFGLGEKTIREGRFPDYAGDMKWAQEASRRVELAGYGEGFRKALEQEDRNEPFGVCVAALKAALEAKEKGTPIEDALFSLGDDF